MRAKVGAMRNAKLAGGFTYNFGAAGALTLRTRDSDDKINWLTSQAAYSAAVAYGQGSVEGAEFRAAGNTRITVS